MEYKREPLTQQEQKDLAAACKTLREKLVIYTLLDTGLRVSEFCNLQPENIDWVTHDLVFRGKGGKRRLVPLVTSRVRILEDYIRQNGKIGMSVDTVEKIVTDVAQRAMIRRLCTPHVLRHSFAATSLRCGVSLKALQNILGHAHLQTTAKYLNVQPEESLREYREKFMRDRDYDR